LVEGVSKKLLGEEVFLGPGGTTELLGTGPVYTKDSWGSKLSPMPVSFIFQESILRGRREKKFDQETGWIYITSPLTQTI